MDGLADKADALCLNGRTDSPPPPLDISSTPPRPDITMLVVEDDHFAQTVMRAMLESIAEIVGGNGQQQQPPAHASPQQASRIRISVEFASTGEGGWELLRSGKFDLALVDIHLPGLSGLELSWCYMQTLMERTGAVDAGCAEAYVAASSTTASPASSPAATSHSVTQGAAPGGAAAAAAAAPPRPSRETIIIACTADENSSLDTLQQYGIHDVLHKPVSTRDLRHILQKWMPLNSHDVESFALATRAAVRGKLPTCRVLLVEDCYITRTATDLVFRQLGMTIEQCESGEEAMDVLDRRDFDLLLFDVQMPGVSGYALCSWYKEMCRQSGRQIGYVVAVTADPDYEACAEFEIDRCLPKPLSTACVVEAMGQYWRARTSTSSDGVPRVVSDASATTGIDRRPSRD